MLVNRSVLVLMIQRYYNAMQKNLYVKGKKEFPPLLSIVKTLRTNEVWRKETQGWALAFIARKILIPLPSDTARLSVSKA